MKPMPWILVFVLVASGALVACGSSSSSSQPSDDDSGASNGDAGIDTTPTTDAPVDETTADADESGPSDVYPAPHPPLPTSTSRGGAVVAHPKIVPVVFDVDPLAADIETFMGAWDGTTYWKTMLAEYGIDKPVVLPVAHVADAPASAITDDDIQKWLTSQVDGTHAGFPLPDDDTLYALFYPPGVTITYPGLGPSCSAFHGYHGAATATSGANVVYSVISRCASIPEAPVTGVQYVSAVASHEVIEGLTDPFVMSTPAFALTDDDHIAWELYPGGEVGDLCALVGEAFYQPSDFPYTVQRIWSNTAGAAGHDPCIVQQPGKVYFNSAPVLEDDVRIVDNFGALKKTKGVKLALGESTTIEVDLFSDAPTSGPWTVSAVEPFAPTPASHHLQFAWDRTSGVNGEKLHLTITAVSKDPQFGGEFFMIVSKLGTQRTMWSVFVGQA